MRSFTHFALALPAVLGIVLLTGLNQTSLAQGTAQSTESERTTFADSIMEVRADAPISRPHIVRQVLGVDELAAPLDFAVSLAMPRFDELEGRLQKGQKVSRAELEANYLPAKAEYDRVAAWLTGQGFTITLVDSNHTNIFARGSVSSIARVLRVAFARVATVDGEFTSAIEAPSLPADIAKSVLSINGLQPHIRPHGLHHPGLSAGSLGSPNGAPTPADIAAAYAFPANYTGSGQTIAIICNAGPSSSDLTQFWNICGIGQSLTNYTLVSVNGGPASNGDTVEASIDVEWASSMAPGAAIRLYAIPDFLYVDIVRAATQIINDLPQYPGLHQVSISIWGPEYEAGSPTTLTSYSQTYAQLAALGVTVFACSGDGGSNPDPQSGDYNEYGTSFPLTVGYPASDSNLTAVGGTMLGFDSGWNYQSEAVWFNSSEPGTTVTVATGGGSSAIFSRPAWQSGTGMPSGTARLVPDVAAQANAGFLIQGGREELCWGTSLATPIWAAACAVINQARGLQGEPSLGMLGPHVYPLIGTSSFRDIVTGSNGAYNAGAGYDLCTGIGTPNVTNLINSLALTAAPIFTLAASPSTITVASGRSVAFNAIAAGAPAPTYQWTLNSSTTIPGATGTTDSVLLVTGATAANVGTYACTATNSQGSVGTSATLAVVTTAAPGYLTNLSSRVTVGTGGNILIAGFAIAGSGSMDLLLRGVGPALIPAPFGVTGALTNTQLTLYDTVNPNNPLPIVTNSGWSNAFTRDTSTVNVAPQAATLALMNTLGAFTNNWAVGSPDSALEVTPPVGGYTAQISGVGGATGIGLAEVYDADPYNPATRLVNLSTRAQVGTGSNILIGGFVIGGSTAETLLIRAVGPTLAGAPYDVGGTIAQPVLTIYAGSTPIYANSNWGGDSTISTAINTVGAFPLNPSSSDAALLITLPPASNYTAQVSGVSNTTGIALLEVYDVF